LFHQSAFGTQEAPVLSQDARIIGNKHAPHAPNWHLLGPCAGITPIFSAGADDV
jgi:hypothetical protein